MTSTEECVFCDIVAGRAPASIVFEDDQVLAFMDIQPVTPGHLLVVPRKHVAHLDDLPSDLGTAMFAVALQLTRSLRRSGLRCEGVNLFLADGAAAFQEIFHTHLHVFPRYAGDGFRIEADWQRKAPEELAGAAAQVVDGLRAVRVQDEPSPCQW